MIEFHLDPRSGVSPYQQLVQQVRNALRLGLLEDGDQLPTVKDVVADLAINPNTVLRSRPATPTGSRRIWSAPINPCAIPAGRSAASPSRTWSWPR
ncbi:GntR family transcriptional regulator [Nocardioides insulae]|uniref:GntR family transcriptional regulator n=1 Tax=Nocardioides insulae TaxID=394734 RepID=UPI00041776E1|nr:GntR family transcriptional regulator [Nocardioides insulae]